VSQTAAATRAVSWSTNRLPFDPAGLAAWAAPFVLIVYLAFQNGGYDLVVRSQVGIAVWWIVLLGALVGVLPVTRPGRAGWIGLLLLGAFAAWTALSLTWTESHERTMAEAGRVAAYLGIFALALAAQGRVAMRHALNGTAAAIALVGLLAVFYRLHPGWFTLTETDRFYPQSNRLNFPLGYWNALAAFMAMGVPLALHAAATARTLAMRAAAAGAVPVMVFCAYLTISRGAVGMIGVALIVFLLLTPERVYRLATVAICGVGSAILIVAGDRYDITGAAFSTSAAHPNATGLLRLLVLVVAGVILLQAGVALVERHVTPPRWSSPPRRQARMAFAAAAAGAAVLFIAVGGTDWTSREWDQFKTSSASPEVSQRSSFSRLGSLAGNGRYQYWQVSAAERDSSPLKGTGPGTFEFAWARDGDPSRSSDFVRDAHSLWMETQGELGLIGFGLIAAFFLLALFAGARRALTETDPHRRIAFAAATAAVAAFAVAAAVEWVWEMAVLPVVALLLMALILGGGPPRLVRLEDKPWARGRSRLVLGVLALPSLVAIAIPLATTTAVRDSQAAAQDGEPVAALRDARTAAEIQPRAATPALQQALIFEEQGLLGPARAQALLATRNEPTNWRTWLTLSRIEARSGHAPASVAALRRAKTLNPRSALFAAR
jgi:hypothetical protein